RSGMASTTRIQSPSHRAGRAGRSIADDVAQDRHEHLLLALERVSAGPQPGAGRPTPVTEVGIVEESSNRHRQRFGVARRDEEPGISDDLGWPAVVGGDDGYADAHGLEHGESERFLAD